MPEASNKIKTTRDGQYVLATGTYKPRMKVFDLEELSLKTERVTDAENVDFCVRPQPTRLPLSRRTPPPPELTPSPSPPQVLSSDWTKTLHLQSDRSLELHTQSSSHYRVRMPRHGRAVQYHFPSCDALVGGQGGEVWRMNLEVGRFMKPFVLEGWGEGDGGEGGGHGGGLDQVTGVNAIDINPAHQLLSFGTETANGQGTVEMWDPRSRTRAGILRLPYAGLLAASGSSASASAASALPGVDAALSQAGVAVTALASKFDGLNLAVGTSTGHTLLYDLRANKPYTTKDQGYGLPIKKVEWVEAGPARSGEAEQEGGYVATADSKVVKIWGRESGTNLVSVNPPMQINDMHVYPGTGLVFLANETSPMTGYYIPQLGPAPKWCRFLDNMTEEMEDDQETLIYDDYKFVDRAELDQLQLAHLVGTDALKPYMHGYFVDLRLYTKARAIANPFAYTEHRERLVREKLEQEQESRIRGAKKAIGTAVPQGVKVNRSLAKRAAEAEERVAKRAAGEEEDADEARKRKKKGAVETPSLLKDDRFGALFTNADYQIDEDSREFALLNPSTKPNSRRAEEDDDDDASEGDASDADSDSSDEGDLGFDNRRPKPAPTRRAKDVQPTRTGPARAKPSLIVADGDDDDLASARSARSSHEQRANQSFGQRARELAGSGAPKQRPTSAAEGWTTATGDIIKGSTSGGMEMSFVPEEKTATADKDEKRAAKKQKAEEKREQAKFGAGMEKLGGGQVEEAEIEGEEGTGRTRMRKVARSASRNVTRGL